MFDLDRYEYFEDINQGALVHARAGANILDVGCGSGLLGSEMRAHGGRVTGLDSASAIAGTARARLDRFVLVDLTDQTAVSEALAGEQFDVVVFADVLEHVYDPVGMLVFYRGFLADQGRVIVSVPNAAIWNVRFGLLAGRFNYAQTGTLDKTHIRFFTRSTLERALSDAGLQAERIDVTPGLLRPLVPLVKRVMAREEDDRRAIIDSGPYRIYLRWVYPLEQRLSALLPGLLAFQYIAVAVPVSVPRPVTVPT